MNVDDITADDARGDALRLSTAFTRWGADYRAEPVGDAAAVRELGV